MTYLNKQQGCWLAIAAVVMIHLSLNAADRHWGDSWDLDRGRLYASVDGRGLVHEDGTPFLWIGDTAWELFHRLDRDEVDDYLEDRRSKGFTVIQAALIAEMDGLNTPNAYGHTPLRNNNPLTPNLLAGRRDDYWDHVDYIIDRAEREGIYLALLPTWGEWVAPRFVEEPVFDTDQEAYRYGNFLGKRYADREHIVWILGGDRQPDEWPHATGIWRAMAEGIADGVNRTTLPDARANFSNTLMSYHSMSSSSTWWSQDAWLDFFMWGTYHSEKDWRRSIQVALEDWQRVIHRPTLNAEPPYEEMPRDYKGDNGYFDATDVRNAAYWSILSGSFGFTYGAHPVWQFWEGGAPETTVKLPDLAPTRMTWEEALDLPGAQQMYHLRKLMLSRPFQELQPDQSILVEPPTLDADKEDQIRAARGERFAMIYSPHGKTIKVHMKQFSEGPVNAFWFDPRVGRFVEIGRFPYREQQWFDPPGEGRGNDWVLLLDEEGAGFKVPR